MLTILIPLPTLSVNHTHTNRRPVASWGRNKNGQLYKILRSGGRIKTEATKCYEQQFNDYLVAYTDQIKEFLSAFNPKTNAVRVYYDFFIPAEKYYTKKGTISLRNQDTDNGVKLTQDLIFNLIVNDGYAIYMQVNRLPTKGHSFIRARLKVVNIPTHIHDDYATMLKRLKNGE